MAFALVFIHTSSFGNADWIPDVTQCTRAPRVQPGAMSHSGWAGGVFRKSRSAVPTSPSSLFVLFWRGCWRRRGPATLQIQMAFSACGPPATGGPAKAAVVASDDPA